MEFRLILGGTKLKASQIVKQERTYMPTDIRSGFFRTFQQTDAGSSVNSQTSSDAWDPEKPEKIRGQNLSALVCNSHLGTYHQKNSGKRQAIVHCCISAVIYR